MNPHIPEDLTSLFDSPFTVMHTMPPRDPNDDDDDDEDEDEDEDEDDEEEQDEEKAPPIVREPDPDET
ncbi:MAG: hypothetical protein WB820_15990 [Rhodoplanes sp.]